MRITKPILLVGMMGSGKSVGGRGLALQLGLPFIDADHALVTKYDQTIPQMFTEHGEPEFRKREKAMLAELINGPITVIAAGGGAVLDADSRKLMTERTTSFWLQADLDALWRRVGRDKNRPLLQQENPQKTLENLLDARQDFYAQARFHIDTSGKSLDEVVGAMVATLRGAENI